MEYSMYEREEIDFSGDFRILIGKKVKIDSHDADENKTGIITGVQGEKLVINCHTIMKIGNNVNEWDSNLAYSVTDDDLTIYK